MKVEELIIDGFKSYATRTVITGWDASFNCITGLNGSGKSNILDAICFVLGLTSMNTVRAHNLQDLIYKRGQAGVTKASVTIVFNNDDKEKSPVGFQDEKQISVTRQVLMGGTSKFLINGHRAQQQSVQHLFQSVQLNINNPNFLIMQGRITKVLNMTPTEILSLIEEAAGTRMFQDRREKALKTIAKKDQKVANILESINNDIEPKLNILRKEKRDFLEYQQAQAGMEKLEKIVVAHDYVAYNDRFTESNSLLSRKKAEWDESERTVKELQSEIENSRQQLEELRAEKETQLKAGGSLQKLEADHKSLQQALVKANTDLEFHQSSLDEEISAEAQLQDTLKQLNSQLADEELRFGQVKEAYDANKLVVDNLMDEVSNKEELFQSLQTGISSKEGQETGYASQLQDARQKVNDLKTSIAKAHVRIDHLKRQIAEDVPKIEKAKNDTSRMERDLHLLRQASESIQQKLESSGWDPQVIQDLKEKERSLAEELRSLGQQVENAKRRVSRMDFSHANGTTIKGLVAELFTLDDKNIGMATALEICAGGRLYNIVVDTDATGAKVVSNNRLKRRVTVLPLNKISARRLPQNKLEIAQRLAPNKVDLALDLIGYKEEVAAAMEYVFGNTLVCADSQSAKRVTFDPQVRTKSVTLEGDIYDPQGTLSGGSRPQSDGLLVSLQQYVKANDLYRYKQHEMDNMQREIQQEEAKASKLGGLKRNLDLKQHEIKLTQEQLTRSASGTLLANDENRRVEIAELEKRIKEDEGSLVSASAILAQIEKDMEEFKNNKGSKLDELKNTIAGLQQQQKQLQKQLKEQFKIFQKAEVSIEQIRSDCEASQAALMEKQTAITDLHKAIKKSGTAVAKIDGEEKQLKRQLDSEKSLLLGMNEEIREIERVVGSKKKLLTEIHLRQQTLKHEIETENQETEGLQRGVAMLIEKNPWIEHQKQYFGQPGPFDFTQVDMRSAKMELGTLSDRIKNLKRGINAQVLNMIESVEKKEAALKSKVNTIEKDKRKIEDTIKTLDEYKREALQRTWVKVSEDLGKIFGDLLPGGMAKLQSLNPNNIFAGLAFKVSLGGIWKEGLAELSGGQRSLVALSLILALLQFKPAPMYILDEVDAALDLQHTQNIGHIIKTRFKGSQFIIVSLKEGMFSNANRVFNIRFQEGTSVVSVN